MFDIIRKFFSVESYTEAKIPTTQNISEESITLHGEDPGVIPPDDIPNPLTDEVKKADSI